MSSPCLPFVLDERPPYVIQMLKEVFTLSVRDYEVLVLCADFPFGPMNCSKSQRDSAKKLKERGFLTYVFRKQRWELTVAGHHALAAIPMYIQQYKPAAKSLAEVIRFPGEGKKVLTK